MKFLLLLLSLLLSPSSSYVSGHSSKFLTQFLLEGSLLKDADLIYDQMGIDGLDGEDALLEGTEERNKQKARSLVNLWLEQAFGGKKGKGMRKG